MLTKLEYESLKTLHEEACKRNDYSNMVMVGDENYNKMKEYESQFCFHQLLIELFDENGVRMEQCISCKKIW